MSNNEIWATSVSNGIIRIPNKSVPLVQLEGNNTQKNIESIYNFFGQAYVSTIDRELYKQRTKKLKKLSLELRLKSSKLNVLRNQMNPHFIFNSINAVQSYIFSDMKAEANL